MILIFSIGVSFYLRTVLMDLKKAAAAEEKTELMEKHKGDQNGNAEDEKTEEKTEIQTTEEN